MNNEELLQGLQVKPGTVLVKILHGTNGFQY
jgi:hypothetical protein